MELSSPTLRFQRESSKPLKNSPGFKVIDLGGIDFDRALTVQKDLLSQIVNQTLDDTLLFCQHPHSITLGRLAKEENILAGKELLIRKRIRIFHIDRGGDVTYHGPGQLVVYPIFNLARHGKDLKKFLNQLEEVVIDFLQYFGIKGIRKHGLTGVWVEDKKLASIGIGVKKWVTFHGVAININTDLEYFSLIRPCGLNKEMTSLEQILGKRVELAKAKSIIVDCFRKNFNFKEVK